MGKLKWHHYPDEKPTMVGEYLVRGVGGINNCLHHWVCLWIEGGSVPTGFYYNGNEFNQCPSGEYEWIEVKEL